MNSSTTRTARASSSASSASGIADGAPLQACPASMMQLPISRSTVIVLPVRSRAVSSGTTAGYGAPLPCQIPLSGADSVLNVLVVKRGCSLNRAGTFVPVFTG
jgi:hypothetical protein